MTDSDRFPIPATGSIIPKGWFARLVAFINSLVLHGDGRYTLVNRSAAGTSVTLTPSLINALNRSAAPSAGGATGIEAAVSGGTASVTLTGGTGSVNLVGTGGVTISGNTNTGEIEIFGSTGGGGGGSASYPAWGSLVAQTINPTWDATYENMDPEILGYSGFLYVSLAHVVSLNESNREQEIYCYVYVDGKEIFAFQRNIVMEPYVSGGTLSVTLADGGQLTTMVPVHSGSTVTAQYYDSSGSSPTLAFTLYKDTSA